MNYEADIAYLEHIDIAILSSVNLWCRMHLYETEEHQKESRLMVGIDFKNGKLLIMQIAAYLYNMNKYRSHDR